MTDPVTLTLKSPLPSAGEIRLSEQEKCLWKQGPVGDPSVQPIWTEKGNEMKNTRGPAYRNEVSLGYPLYEEVFSVSFYVEGVFYSRLRRRTFGHRANQVHEFFSQEVTENASCDLCPGLQ